MGIKDVDLIRNLLIALLLIISCSACAGEKNISSDIAPERKTDIAAKNKLWVENTMMRFKQVWQLPEDRQIGPDLKTTYIIKISKSGEIIDKKMIISSGNKAYDKSIETALNKIKLLPPPDGKDECVITFVPPHEDARRKK